MCPRKIAIDPEKKLVENIILALQSGPIKTIDFIADYKKKSGEISKQAIYAKIRDLKEKEILVSFKGKISYNIHWLQKKSEFFEMAQYYYKGLEKNEKNTGTLGFATLKDGEKVSYTFSNLNSLDIFWNHVLLFLLEVHNKEESFCAYDMHTWQFFTRQETEIDLFKATQKYNHKFFQLIGGRSQLDKKAGKFANRQDYFYKIMTRRPFEKINYYVSCTGEYLVEVHLNKKIAQEIEVIYKKAPKNPSKNLIPIMSSPGKSKITIIRNKKKANKMRKLFSKNFQELNPDYFKS